MRNWHSIANTGALFHRGSSAFLGSCFIFCDVNTLLTAAHCVSDREPEDVRLAIHILGNRLFDTVSIHRIWWNKDEPGSGFGIDYQNGTLIVEVYSYLAGGASQWYLAAGPMANNMFTATLDKYAGGQCISCASYMAPALSGNDGTITISFTSPTTATVDLPGGRHIQIQRYFQP